MSGPSLVAGGGASAAHGQALIGVLPLQSDFVDVVAERTLALQLETSLRNAGFTPVLAATRDPRERQLEVFRQQGVTQYLSGEIIRWRSGNINGARPRVSVALSVHATQQTEALWTGKESVVGSFGGAVSATANKVVTRLVQRLPVKHLLAAGQSDQYEPQLQAALAGEHRIDEKDSGYQFLKTSAARKELVGPMVGRSVAVYYGDKPPVDQLSQFDRLILEADAINEEELSQLTANGATPYAYLSVGEVGPHRRFANRIPAEWILGSNNTWGSKVLDLSNPAWRKFLLERVDVLQRAGYKGLFLDTMDSYQLYAKQPEERVRQEAGLVTLLQAIKQQYPDLKLISNRGFEILDQAAQYLEAVAAESLYASWDNNKKIYTEVDDTDRQWLLGHLNKAKDTYGLDVIVIDYVPPSRRKEAKAVAKVIAAHGFVPWISTPSLDHVGIGLLESLPRKVMMLHDSSDGTTLYFTLVHTLLAMPLEYMGYVPHYHDIATEGLPDQNLQGAFAAVAYAGFSPVKHPGFQNWMGAQVATGMRLITLAHPGFYLNQESIDAMGLKHVAEFDSATAKVSHKSSSLDFEKQLPSRIENFSYLVANSSAENKVHLSYKDARGRTVDSIVTGPWGGMIISPTGFFTDIDNVVYWHINPFEFLKEALGVSDAPMPDVTTENGRRLFLAHIDGDALPSWAEFPGRKLGAELIKDDVLSQYDLPHTVSIVEGEMTGFEQDADRRERMFSTAREIFALPNVEIATHTYSHPFKWQKIAGYPDSGKYNLKLDGYSFSPEREAQGSKEFIDKNLAPEGKQTDVFLWSGDALPTERMLAAVARTGMVNLNGGNTTIRKAMPAHSRVSPMARPVGAQLQVYAPIMNENVYTNDWTGPFDGFRHVIETFEMTDKPFRLKPINIYYHFYIGTKLAGLRSLKEVYDWTLTQPIHPVYVSEYAVKVPDFRKATLGRYLDGTWKLSDLGNIRSLRIIGSNKRPDMTTAEGVVGATELHDGVYLHTNGSNVVTFQTTEGDISQPHLVAANGRVLNWRREGNSVEFRIKGHVPVQIELGGVAARACGIQKSVAGISRKITASGTAVYNFQSRDTGNVRLNCQT